MSDNATLLEIPRDLLPADGRFGCGPSKVRPEQLAGIARRAPRSRHLAPPGAGQEARRPRALGLSRAVPAARRLRGRARQRRLDRVLGCRRLRPHRATAAQHLIFGEFGGKFARRRRRPVPRGPARDQAPSPAVAPSSTPIAGVDVYAWPHNETSTGVMAPVTRVARRRRRASPSIDATSARRRHRRSTSRETDVYYFAPQKNFASDGGLWFALVSPAAIERVERIAASDRYIPEFLSASRTRVDNSRLNQTLNTPALATLLLLENQLEWMNGNGGLAWADARTRESSDVLYDWAESVRRTRPRSSPNPAHRSQVVVTIDFDDVDRRRRRRRRRCARTASSTPSRTASSAATSCASPPSPRSTRTTCAPSSACDRLRHRKLLDRASSEAAQRRRLS